MFDIHEKLGTFYENHVRLSSTEQKKLAGYRDTNLTRLNNGLDKLSESNNTSYAYPSRVCNQGSYAMHTLNQHADNDYDIDVAIIFRKENLPAMASDARKRIEAAFLEAGGNFARDPEARTNAVTIWYSEGYHIDFAVYREYENEFGQTTIEHAGSDWTTRNPSEVTDWFLKEVKQCSPAKDYGAIVAPGQMRRVVRLLKWFSKSRESWSLPGGMIISALVSECYRPDAHRDDLSLYNTIIAISNRLQNNPDVQNPVDQNQKLTAKTKYLSQVKRLKEKLDVAITQLDVLSKSDCTDVQAMKAWYWLFQHPFWEPGRETKSVENSTRREYASNAPFGDLKIVAQKAMRKNGRLTEYYPSGGRALPKKVWLRFSIAKTSIRPPYEVQWIVQNYGHEAEEVDDLVHKTIDTLNGDSSVQWESTAYKGNHTMICELHRDSEILARACHVVRIKRS